MKHAKTPTLPTIYMIFMLLFSTTTFGQFPIINNPQATTTQQNSNIIFPTQGQKSNPTNSNAQIEQYERERQAEQRKKEELNQLLYSESVNKPIEYDLPSQQNQKGTEYFRQASDKINRMLNGTEPMNLKKAIFAIENAYFEGKLDYQKFDKEIQNLITIAKLKTAQDGYNWNDPQTKNIMLFRVMADTLKVKITSQENEITSYPMQYDFDDYTGAQDWSKMFVTKLLSSKSGQCHSLPLLYLILCEEAGANANLAFSPSHSYIKIKDNSNNWYNIELTSGRIVTDAFISGSGYITAEALKNHIYMEPLTKQQTIAHCLSDLGKGYAKKYGYDTFVSQCVNSTLDFDPTNIFARQVKSDYQTLRFEYVVNQVGRPRPDVLQTQYPKVYKLLDERNATYQIVDESGFQAMPEQAYQSWLNSVNKEAEKREQQGQLLRLTRTLK